MSSIAQDQQIDYSRVSQYEAWVLGGGISGLTTAIVLQALGLKTAILSEESSYESASLGGQSHIPTLYAMASAYPHNLRVNNLERVSDLSQLMFSQLHRMEAPTGIELYRMFEVFEHEPESAALGYKRREFQVFDGTPEQLRASINPPARKNASHLWGWTFSTFFADMPIYLRFLRDYFISKGGVIESGTFSVSDVLRNSSGRYLANCMGWSARAAFGDDATSIVVRGKQVLVPGAPMTVAKDGLPLAYNYTPSHDVYPRADGDAEYVHFFPRRDGWVLGQTREPGMLDENGNWSGLAVQGVHRQIGDHSIPAPIVDLNESLLRSWLGEELNGRPLISRVGYRFYRDPSASGVRLECESFGDNLLVHNYGHGGSGITMSWGCAMEAVRLLFDSAVLVRKGIAGDQFQRTICDALSD